MTSAKYLPPNGQILPRNLYLKTVSTAIEAREYRFAREAVLTWLAAFPGDLTAGLYYATALFKENHSRQALAVLEGLCQVDPEFLEAQELYLQVRRACGYPTAPEALSTLIALGVELDDQETIASWGRQLWMARLALKLGDLENAEQLIHSTLAADPPTSLAAVTHLEIIESSGQTPLPARRSLAEYYHKRWPDCLQCTLLLADWLMDGGESEQAVALLHEAAARDVGGQVAGRLWGQDHPYRAVWPEQPEVAMKAAIPAAVASALGWNQLPAGETNGANSARPAPISAQEISPTRFDGPKTTQLPALDAHPAPTAPARTPPVYSQVPETLLPIQEELERLAGRLNQSGVTRSDGRFPVYVVFSSRCGLERQYGVQAMADLEKEMQALVQAVQKKHGWGARLFLADDAACTAPLGIQPAKPGDPWELKLALADLDAALSKHGEMIGAVLIVGGPEIVPFHHLPNPVDDDDLDVPSDNPYATRDENYFIPEWPVGRLPGGAGKDAGLLLSSLRKFSAQHRAQGYRRRWLNLWWQRLAALLKPRWHGKGRPSFGYTAAVWRQASLSVFRPIGEPRLLLVSPPMSANGSSAHAVLPFPIARLGYFNLHGLVDSAEWYGQRDPLEEYDGPDYPVALRPQDIGVSERQNSACVPEIIFSEACYGGHIKDKTTDTALALKFLASGSSAVAASTSMAYGSVSTPLIAADLLGQAFWNGLRDGRTAGESLRLAKIRLAREMHDRQGYLDGEDQKTLISFVLYGDPLAQPSGVHSSSKGSRRQLKIPSRVKTVCDRLGQPVGEQPIPPEMLVYVKHVVEQYLPGMANAQLTFTQEHTRCSGHLCPTGQLGSKAGSTQQPGRSLVTLSKKVQRSDHIHQQVARLTLDSQGKLVKLAVSR